MTDRQETDQGKQKNAPSRGAIIFGTIMGLFFVLFYGVGYVYAIRYDVFSLIGQTVGAFCMVLLVHTAVTAPRNAKRPASKRQGTIVFCGMVLAMAFLVAWAYWPDSDRWRPYTFDDELAAIEAKRAVPDGENAALLYEALLGRVEPYPSSGEAVRDRNDPFWNTPWVASEHPELSQWLDRQDTVIAQLIEACRFDECRFAVESRMFASTEPRISKRYDKLKLCFNMLLVGANRDIGEGRIESGIEKYRCALQMGKHCLQQPTVLDFFRGFGRCPGGC